MIEAKRACIDFGSGAFPAGFNAAWTALGCLLNTDRFDFAFHRSVPERP
jgi:hypothetical protein